MGALVVVVTYPSTNPFIYPESEGIEEIIESQKSKVESQKMLYDGQLYILRGGQLFNAQGSRVK